MIHGLCSIIFSNSAEQKDVWWFRFFDHNNEWRLVNAGEKITLTTTYYTYYPNTLTESSLGETKGISTSSKEYSMLFANIKKYWLASRYELAGGSEECINYAWGIFNVDGYRIKSARDNYLIYIGNAQATHSYALMPMVYLKTDVILKSTGQQIDGCNEWRIN